MRSDEPSSVLRQYGQRSLTSPLLSRPRPISRGDAKGKTVSLSEFLNRKLGNTHLSNGGSIKEKQTSFSSVALVNGRESGGISPKLKLPIFPQFSNARKEGGFVEPGGACNAGGSCDSKKRSSPSSDTPHIGEAARQSGPKYMVVLGDDPKPREKRIKRSYLQEKTQSLFNHYASGTGLWGCGTEGIDSEEVGCNETWEGMGSTTLGGLEWH